jgi:hypothetical protein
MDDVVAGPAFGIAQDLVGFGRFAETVGVAGFGVVG